MRHIGDVYIYRTIPGYQTRGIPCRSVTSLSGSRPDYWQLKALAWLSDSLDAQTELVLDRLRLTDSAKTAILTDRISTYLRVSQRWHT